jgi:hypothetical protein
MLAQKTLQTFRAGMFLTRFIMFIKIRDHGMPACKQVGKNRTAMG